jgi:D-tyrosyl-tRNA(Tyr) deacylase
VIALIQRVSEARVAVGTDITGEIGAGILAFVCAEPEDTNDSVERLLEKILSYRVFSDGGGKMNRSLRDAGGGLLLVPQFTLGADTTSGTRPSFSSSALPTQARPLFDHLLQRAGEVHSPVAAGRFGEHMKVSLVNDGPVTFWLRSKT